MLATTAGRCCSPACRRLWATARRQRRAATAAMQQQEQQPAALHSGTAAGVKDQDRLQLNVEGKLGIPREIYEAVSQPAVLAASPPMLLHAAPANDGRPGVRRAVPLSFPPVLRLHACLGPPRMPRRVAHAKNRFPAFCWA